MTDDVGWSAGLAEKRINAALTLACIEHPYLSALAQLAEIRFGDYVETAGVTASGIIIIAPAFFGNLTIRDIAIILTHELMHLFRRSHERSENAPDPWLINIADDFIINDIISRSLDCDRGNTVLRCGLIWEKFLRNFKNAIHQSVRPAHTYSLEEMVVLLRGVPGLGKMPAWQPRKTCEKIIPEGWLEKALRKSMPSQVSTKPESFPPEIITSDIERKLFPEERPEITARRVAEFAERARQSVGECAALAMIDAIVHQSGTGNDADFRRTQKGRSEDFSGRFEMLRDMYRTPWESALQRWFDSTMPGERSWSRPSRRGAWQTDVVLPGRNRQGWLLHVILDVNESMADLLPSVLGALAGFCEANHVDTIHLVQVSDSIIYDEHVTPESLEFMELKLSNPKAETLSNPILRDYDEIKTGGGQFAPLHKRYPSTPKTMGERHPRRGVKKRPFRIKRPKEPSRPLPLPEMMTISPLDGAQAASSPCGTMNFALVSAFALLEEKYGAEATVVVTGGELAFPPPPTFDVLWALVGPLGANRFAAPYGTAVHISAD